MAINYIADLHIGHANVISYDNRPFADVDEMNQALVNNWKSVVTDDDTVYVLRMASIISKLLIMILCCW